jgi:hypothetical protein
MKFYGIADAHGIESFRPVTYNVETGDLQIDPRELGMMNLRANANRQRHAVVYQVDIGVDTAKGVLAMIEAGEFKEALVKLKEEAKSISLARSPGAEKSWGLIPNPDLDPFSN